MSVRVAEPKQHDEVLLEALASPDFNLVRKEREKKRKNTQEKLNQKGRMKNRGLKSIRGCLMELGSGGENRRKDRF